MNVSLPSVRSSDPVVQPPFVQGVVEEPLDLDVAVEHGPEPELEVENDEVAEVVGDPEPEDEYTFINRLLHEGMAGDAESMAIAVEYIKHDPNDVKFLGSLGARSRAWIIDEVTDDDLLSQEFAWRNVAALELELRSQGDTPLIRMAADRVLNAYIAAGVNDYLSTVRFNASRLPPEHVAAQESTERRFLIAVQALEVAERLEKQIKPRAKAVAEKADSQGVDAPGDS